MFRGSAWIEAEFTVLDHEGNLLVQMGEHPASRKEQLVRENDKYKKILGDGNARVNISLGEKIGGPYGYSSVDLRVSVTLSADQNVDSIQLAKQYALEECTEFLENSIKLTYQNLVEHLELLYAKESS